MNLAYAHFSPDGRLIALRDLNDRSRIRIWDTRLQKFIPQLPIEKIEALVASEFEIVVNNGGDDGFFSPDGSLFVSVLERRRTVRVWDVETGQVVGTPLVSRPTVQGGATAARASQRPPLGLER